MGRRKVKPSSSLATGVPKPQKSSRMPLFGSKGSSSLPTVQKKIRTKALFVTRFTQDVSSSDVEQSLKEQMELTHLTCTKLKTKFNSYSSFHISVAEDDFDRINNTDVWPIGCLIAPYYGKLQPSQIYSMDDSDKPSLASSSTVHLDKSRPPSPSSDVSIRDVEGGSVITGGAQVEGTVAPA
jgi:hypothetical protein